MSPGQYYEFHIKVRLPEEKAEYLLKELRTLGLTRGAHLSRNAFKSYGLAPTGAASGSVSSSDNSNNCDDANRVGSAPAKVLIYFLTVRRYSIGFKSALAEVKALMAECTAILDASGGELVSVQREFAVFDTNIHLDAGWIDGGANYAITPSFMLTPETAN
jgi:hypothetical protein